MTAKTTTEHRHRHRHHPGEPRKAQKRGRPPDGLSRTIPTAKESASDMEKIPTTTNPALSAVSPNGQVEAPLDPFDPAALRVEGMAGIEVEQVLTAVPVRKPKRNEFFRVHPEHVLDTLVLERDTGMDKEIYLVAPEIQHLVLPELRRTRLFVAINKHGTVFLWPLKLPLEGNDTGRRVFDTALQGATDAQRTWVKLAWDRGLGGYELFRAKGDLGEPQWPDKSFRDLLEIAFRHYRIDREDHDVVRELAGEL